ncbi:FAD-dependent monooxygenase [Catenuloplanes atrovinosus]|uniref:2-polyprenyl-6-methoxyphenol hydroxylase-like FAD-dependent oxidoreductase n=1 Tax=Catenuloplanes atrovinosus TaxID=137266 RepID=A0AAE3YLR6_9ACTN|nr:FAD-dependent monooxygenase [Catenuloplanes atrovinosus]MDR7276154.1 2-polyprenyl-6-methoxyphenol hydroxylase-like FAD-dependent oxidoreductase [Catenuloplanes atrovinosus]
MRRVLISGASIAGPALAYWLDRYGFEVTVVERAPAVRRGGYPIDVRGSAMRVCERMGLLPALREATIDTRRMTVLKPDGRVASSLDVSRLLGGGQTERDVELPRGELSDLLYGLTKDRVEYVFGDSVRTITQHDGAVEVAFEHGPPRTVEVVVGCDGLHSRTRALAFGPERDYHHYLGFCFAGFTMPNTRGLEREAVIQNAPGLGATMYAVRDQPGLYVLMVFTDPQPPRGWTEADVRGRVHERFAGLGGEAPALRAAMDAADDLYFDTVSQIRMPSWSAGRVALAGDAGYAPSFLSGQGTSLALCGAYVLAGELRRAPGDPARAFAAYESAMRDYVRRNQDMATGASFLVPRTRHGLWLRNQGLRLAPFLSRLSSRIDRNATALRIEDYAA